MSLRYHIVNGQVMAIGYNEIYNTEVSGDEPFLDDFSVAYNWRLSDGEWQLVKPEEPLAVQGIELPMSDHLQYQRTVIIKKGPEIDPQAQTVTIDLIIKHYQNGVWVYDKNIQDKEAQLLADGDEFVQLNGLFNNADAPIVFWQKVALVVRQRISDGTVERKLTY